LFNLTSLFLFNFTSTQPKVVVYGFS